MAIQSSINSLLSQAQSLAAFYTGFKKADDIIKDTTTTKNEAKIQTDIAAGNAPMKDGKVDPEWLKKRREEMYKRFADDNNNRMFDNDGKLTESGKEEAHILDKEFRKGRRFAGELNDFYNDPRVQDYIKSSEEEYYGEHNIRAFSQKALNSVIETQSPNSELKNEVAEKLARSSVEARTASINKAKSDFDEHTASLIKKYGKGSGNP